MIRALILASLIASCMTQPAGPRIVAFGDSITRGVGSTSVEARYIVRLEQALGEPIDNRSLGGTTAYTQTIDQIATYDGAATWALWFSCTNDLLQDTPPAVYEAALLDGVQQLQANGLIVYLGTCPKIKDNPYRGLNWRELHPQYMAAIRRVAAETGASLVDIDAVYDPITMESTVRPFHPDDDGHGVIAAAFLAALKRRAYVPIVGAYPAP